MNIVADTGSVVSRIIVAEYAETFQFADCHLCNIGHQIVWNTVRILTDQSAFMCADRIEITQESNAPLVVGCVYIPQDLFNHQFGASVGIGGGQRKSFVDRNGFRGSVYGGRGTEHHLFNIMCLHHIT